MMAQLALRMPSADTFLLHDTRGGSPTRGIVFARSYRLRGVMRFLLLSDGVRTVAAFLKQKGLGISRN